MHRVRLALWLLFVGLFIAAAYGFRVSEGKPDEDALYQYSVTANSLVQYAFVLIIVLAIAGFSRELIALRRPRSWPRAAGLAALVAVGLVVSLKLLDLVFHAGEEQGLVPKDWDSSRAGAYFANFAVIVIVAPFVEELTYRGLGYSLIEPFGELLAILAVGILFALSHGLVVGLPELALFGCALAWLRARTDSAVPGMFVHGFFNAIALLSVFA